MMSASSGTSRANSRTSKDKTAKTQHTHNSKADGPPSKMQATPEQMRLAEMISDKSAADEELKRKIQELAELTGKDNDNIAIALHDCENDLNRAYLMLVEGENDQGEWKESGKKKKRQPAAAQKNSDVSVNHAGDNKCERTDNDHGDRHEKDWERDRDSSEFMRNDTNSRRGRRNDTRPPRLSRGRGRDRDRGNDMIWRDGEQDVDGDNRDEIGGSGRERGRGRGRGVNGPGRRGGRGGRGGGGGGGIGGGSISGGAGDRDRDRGFRSQRFDKGPQIDTWTNETAENAEKEKANLWSDSVGAEDWNDDSWTGSLTETKVFTASSVQGGPMGPEPLQPPVMSDTNSLPQANSLPQRLDLNALLQKTANDVSSVSAVSAESQFITQYNKEATESIKNSIGIGSSSRQNLAATSAQNSTVSQLASMAPLSAPLSVPLAAALQQTSRLPPSQPVCPPSAVGLQQRSKPQKSKLPPPSKIPASAVEMPGHMVTSLDVQFGNLEFGADSFSFGSADSAVTSNYTASTTPTVRYQMNHLDQVNSPDSGLASAIRSAGTTPTKSGITGLDQTSPRGIGYQNSTYSTTPTKKEISSPEPIPFPSSQSERKTSPLVNSQRPGQAPSSLQQGSLTTNSADTSGLYGQSTSYQSSSYKPSSINSSQSYTHSSSTLSQSGQYQSPLTSQTSQNQFQPGQNQYQTSQNQYPSYQSGPSFQSQTGFSSSQPNQSSLYQSATSTGSYQSQTGSTYPSRDDQSGSSFQTNVSQSSGSSYQRDGQPSASYQRESQTGASYPRDGQSAGSYQRETPSSGSTYQRENQAGSSSSYQIETQPASPYQRESQSTGPYPRDGQSGGSTYQREAQSAGSSYTRDSQSSSGSYQRDTQPGVTSYQRDTQPSGSYQRESSQTGVTSYQRESQSASSYPRDTPSAGSYQRDSQSASSYPRDSQSSSAYQRDSQSASSYPRDSQTSSSYPRDNQTTSSYHRDSQSAGSSSYQRDSQSGQSQSAYGPQQTYNSSNHQSTLQTSPLSTAKLVGDSLSKMTVKDHSVDSHQPSQHTYDHSSTTTASLTSTTSTSSSSLASGTTGVSTAVTVATPSNINMTKASLSSSSTSKAPPNLPPGVPLLNAQYIMNMGQGGIPPYFSLQQPLYPTGYEELQLLQQRGVALGSYYDMSNFGSPTTMAGRDQTALANVPYTVADGKLNRVDAQSPVPTTQPQQTQSAHQQPFINPGLHPGYGYYPAYPSMLHGAGFQYPHTMFMPPVTNTAAHGGSAASSQYQKAYGSHSYGGGKGYDDLSQPQDFSKGYGGVAHSQSKVAGSVSSVTSGSGSATDLAGYGKSHGQVNAFDKQAFHTSTPTSFNLPMSSGNQAGHMGAPTTPYHQYVPMMPHQAHSMLHHPLQQDSSTTGRGSQPSSSQLKTGASKPYGNYWPGN